MTSKKIEPIIMTHRWYEQWYYHIVQSEIESYGKAGILHIPKTPVLEP